MPDISGPNFLGHGPKTAVPGNTKNWSPFFFQAKRTPLINACRGSVLRAAKELMEAHKTWQLGMGAAIKPWDFQRNDEKSTDIY